MINLKAVQHDVSCQCHSGRPLVWSEEIASSSDKEDPVARQISAVHNSSVSFQWGTIARGNAASSKQEFNPQLLGDRNAGGGYADNVSNDRANHSLETKQIVNPALASDTALLQNLAVNSPVPRANASAVNKDIKFSEPVDKDFGTLNASRKKGILNALIRTTALATGTASIIAPMLLGAGIPAAAMFAVIGVAILCGAMVNRYVGRESELFANAMGSLVANQSAMKRSMAGATVGLAASHNSSARGRIIAGLAGYESVQLAPKNAQVVAGMAGANAAGVAVSTVDKLTGAQTMIGAQVGAAVGGVVGGLMLGSIEGSTRLGKRAGAYAVKGANWGKAADNISFNPFATPLRIIIRSLVVYDLYQSLIPPANSEIDYPGKAEVLMGVAGGIVGGIYEAVDYHVGGNISKLGATMSSAYHFVRYDYVNHAPPVSPEIRTRPDGTADFRYLTID